MAAGLSEPRHVPPPLPGGFQPGWFGFPPPALPTWRLHPTVVVTGLKSLPAKR